MLSARSLFAVSWLVCVGSAWIPMPTKHFASVIEERPVCAKLRQRIDEGIVCVTSALPETEQQFMQRNSLPIDPIRRRALGMAVDLNHASLEELVTLPRIGPALARRIIAARPYRNTAELLGVSGIGPATVQRLKDWVVISPYVPAE